MKQDVLQLSPQRRKIRAMKDRKLDGSHKFVLHFGMVQISSDPHQSKAP